MMAGKNQAALAVCAQTKVIFPFKAIKEFAPGEDRTHDLQISQVVLCDYETDALPTALPRRLSSIEFLGARMVWYD